MVNKLKLDNKETLFPVFNTDLRLYKTNEENYFAYDSSTDKKFFLNNAAIKILMNCDGTKNIKTIQRINSDACDKESIINCILNFSTKNIIKFLKKSYSRPKKLDFIQQPLIEKVVWAITNICNLKCTHCYQNSSNSSRSEIATNTIIKTINSLKDNILKITLTGGEPFLRKDILGIIDCIRSAGLGLRILTNGTIISDKIIKKIKKLKIYDLRVSLDGITAETHDAWRGVNGSFNKVTKNIQNLMESKINLRICTNITKINFEELNKFPDFLLKLGIQKWNVSAILPLGRSEGKFNELKLDDNQLEVFVKQILTLSHKYKNQLEIDFGVNYNKLDRFIQAGKNPDFLRPHCFYKLPNIFIDSGGKIHPCVWLTDISIGNIRKNNIETVVRNRYIFDKIKLEFSNLPYCVSCKFFKLCGGGCRKIAQITSGDLKGKDKMACDYFTKAFPIFFDSMNDAQKKFINLYIN